MEQGSRRKYWHSTMAEEQKKCSLRSVYMSWVCALLCLLVEVVPSVSSQPAFKQLFLNSPAHCGRSFTADKNAAYNVLVDAGKASHSFQSCQLTFQSLYPDGRLCVKQRKIDFKFKCNVKLQLYDGQMGVDADKTLDCNGNPLTSVEWCTSGRNLTVRLAENGKNPSVQDLSIDILVYDLQNVHRTASLDRAPSCQSTYQMDGSRVLVTNIDPSHHVGMQLFPQCALTFEYKGQEKNRTMCMIFEASQQLNPGCSKLNYTLEVFSFLKPGKKYKELSGTRSCENPLPREWCSNSTEISLVLHRHTGKGTEDAVVFYAMVLDHEGGLDTLPPLTVPQPLVQASPSVNLTIGLSVAGLLLVLAVIGAVIFLRRRRRLGRDGRTESTKRITQSMQDPSVSGRSFRQQNLYYDRPSPGSVQDV